MAEHEATTTGTSALANIDLPNDLTEVRKLIAYVTPAVAAAGTLLVKTGHVTPSAVLAIVIAFVVGVPLVFHPTSSLAKGLFSLLAAVVQTLALFITNDMDWSQISGLDWLTVGGAIIGSVLATYVPNAPTPIQATLDPASGAYDISSMPSSAPSASLPTVAAATVFDAQPAVASAAVDPTVIQPTAAA